MKSALWAMTMLGVFTLMGFDYSQHSIPINEIHDGGPSKDGIPALYDPQFISADQVQYLNPQDRVLGISINGEARAYPIRILNWHELVNDRVGGKDILVSYCPLCGTGMVFDAQISGKRFLFGVSGKLYNSDVLMYDKETESLWSQIKMEAVTGPMTGTRLTLLPLTHTTWEAWKSKYLETKVLSNETGHFRMYDDNPYQSYEASDQIMFPVKHTDYRLKRKEWILGIVIKGKAKAYPFTNLSRTKTPLKDVLGGKNIVIHFDDANQSAAIHDADGSVIPSVQSYWFAWAAFYPQTELFE